MYRDGKLTARLLDDARTRTLTRGRPPSGYLVQLPLVPHAMLFNQALEWQQIDERRVTVSLSKEAERPAVTFKFAHRHGIMGKTNRGDIDLARRIGRCRRCSHSSTCSISRHGAGTSPTTNPSAT